MAGGSGTGVNVAGAFMTGFRREFRAWLSDGPSPSGSIRDGVISAMPRSSPDNPQWMLARGAVNLGHHRARNLAVRRCVSALQNLLPESVHPVRPNIRSLR